MATREELGTILTAINSIKLEVAALSSNLRSVERRVSRLEEAVHTPPASLSADEWDGGVSLQALEASRPPTQLKTETPGEDTSTTAEHRLVPVKIEKDSPTATHRLDPTDIDHDSTTAEHRLAPADIRQLDADSPVRASDLQRHLEPIASGIENLTRCILGIEKALARLTSGPNQSPTGPSSCESLENGSSSSSNDSSYKPSDSSRQASSSTTITSTQPSSGTSSTLAANSSSGLTTDTEPFPPLEHTSTSTAGNSGPESPSSSTDTRLSECPQGTPNSKQPLSFRPGQIRNVTNTDIPDHSLPVFGQPSTPSLPRKHRVTINVDASPYGKYDDDRSPFSQLTKGSGRRNGRFSEGISLPFYLEARVADAEDFGSGSPLRSRSPKVMQIMPTMTMRG